MIDFWLIVSIIAGILILTGVYLIKRKTGFEFKLKERFLKRIGLWTEPLGQTEDYVHKRIVSWQNRQFVYVVSPVYVSAIIGMILFLTGQWIMSFLIIMTTVVIVLIAYFLLFVTYLRQYTQYPVYGVTVWEELAKKFKDHWAIATKQRLEVNDPLVIETKKLIESILNKFLKEKFQEELAKLGEGKEEEVTKRLREKYSEKEVRLMLQVIKGEEATTTPKAATELQCLDCWAKGQYKNSKFCWNCGADLYPEIFYYKFTRAFCPKEKPYYEFLIITDCDIEKHENFITDTTHVGTIPVRQPLNNISFVKVGEVGGTEFNTENGNVEGTNMTKPVMMVVESKEHIRRVQGRERPLVSSSSRIHGIDEVHDGYLSVKAGVVIRAQEQTIKSLDASIDHVIASSQNLAGQVVQIDQYFSKPKVEEEKKGMSPTLKKWLTIIATVILVIIILGIVFFVLLPLVSSFLFSYHPYLGVWGGGFFQTPGSGTPLISPPHHFFG